MKRRELLAMPALLSAAAAMLLLGAIPVALAAIAMGLIAAGLPAGAAYAIVAVVSIIAAALLAVWAWNRYRAISAAFARSRQELANNIAWIKNAAGLAGEANDARKRVVL